MNPLTNVRNIKKLTETELKLNISGKASWHYQYKDSAWVFIGGLPYDLSEGDVIAIFSQYGEIVNLNLVRDKVTGKSKGFCFLCYEDQRSTILAVDNLNSIKVCGRTLRVDHVEQYKVPKNIDKLDEEALQILHEGCGPDSNVLKTLTNEARAVQSTTSSPTEEAETTLAPTLIQSRKTEEQLPKETKFLSRRELEIPATKTKSKKKSRSRSPRNKKSSDRRNSPNLDRRPSPRRDRRPSPGRERKRSPVRDRRHSPGDEHRPSPSRERRPSSRERRHSPRRERKFSPSRERRRSHSRERRRSHSRERSKRERERYHKH